MDEKTSEGAEHAKPLPVLDYRAPESLASRLLLRIRYVIARLWVRRSWVVIALLLGVIAILGVLLRDSDRNWRRAMADRQQSQSQGQSHLRNVEKEVEDGRDNLLRATGIDDIILKENKRLLFTYYLSLRGFLSDMNLPVKTRTELASELERAMDEFVASNFKILAEARGNKTIHGNGLWVYFPSYLLVEETNVAERALGLYQPISESWVLLNEQDKALLTLDKEIAIGEHFEKRLIPAKVEIEDYGVPDILESAYISACSAGDVWQGRGATQRALNYYEIALRFARRDANIRALANKGTIALPQHWSRSTAVSLERIVRCLSQIAADPHLPGADRELARVRGIALCVEGSELTERASLNGELSKDDKDFPVRFLGLQKALDEIHPATRPATQSAQVSHRIHCNETVAVYSGSTI